MASWGWGCGGAGSPQLTQRCSQPILLHIPAPVSSATTHTHTPPTDTKPAPPAAQPTPAPTLPCPSFPCWLPPLQEVEEDGIEDAFELQAEVAEKIRTGLWVGDCFIYNNAAWRLNYCVGGEVTTLFHLDK